MITRLETMPEFAPYRQQANHIDVKRITGQVTLREFVAGFLSYYPWWIKALYGIRGVFVRFLGMKQEAFAATPIIQPKEVSFEKGGDGTIFTVQDGDEQRFWVASATDKHLTATLIVTIHPLAAANEFECATVVHYHNWAGPIYFNVIRPFHHLVVQQMMQAAIRMYAKN